MVKRCEHCGQTVMATDGQCWHCGKSLPQNSKLKGVKLPKLSTAVPAEEELPMPSIRTILLYAGLTAVALILLITTTRAIGQAPLFLFSGSSITLDGWQPITDSQRQFTLNLPNGWQTIELPTAQDRASLVNSPPLQAVSGTFTALVADAEWLFLGAEDTAVFPNGNPVFVLVAQSQRLQQLSVDEIVNYATQQLPETVTLVETTTTESLTNEPKGNLLFSIEQAGQTWRCQEQFIPGDNATFIVAACTSSGQFPSYIAEFATILRSFQPLRS